MSETTTLTPISFTHKERTSYAAFEKFQVELRSYLETHEPGNWMTKTSSSDHKKTYYIRTDDGGYNGHIDAHFTGDDIIITTETDTRRPLLERYFTE